MDFQKVLEEIHEKVKPVIGSGAAASYIPALANVSLQKFGIAVETLEGKSYALGDADEKFSIQSISKLFNLVLAIRLAGDSLWERVGIEPSGNPFDSLIQLEYEHGIPRNPFINSGALVAIDLLLDYLDDPKRELLNFVNSLGCEDVDYNKDLVRSERETGFKNAALVNYLKAHGNISNDVEKVLDVYFHQCSIEMTCRELARTALFLANGGENPRSGEALLTTSQAKRVNALMLTCGFYNEAGEFAYLVGLPGKSGVSGGIVAVHPGEFSVAVWSPGLNKQGNSVVGMKALELLTTITGKSIF